MCRMCGKFDHRARCSLPLEPNRPIPPVGEQSGEPIPMGGLGRLVVLPRGRLLCHTSVNTAVEPIKSRPGRRSRSRPSVYCGII